MKIKICLPHFISKESQPDLNLPGGWIPGSLRGNFEKRKESFNKCLWSLIHIQNINNDGLLSIPDNRIDKLLPILKNYDISISVITDGKNVCEEILEKYKNYIEVVKINLDDSSLLPFEAREYLFSCKSYDLYFYCEDDIGVYDKNYFKKIKWFANQTNQKGVLMPHRYDNNYSPKIERVYIDGPINQNLLKKFMTPEENSIALNYKNKQIIFDKPKNPHSATFCLTNHQKNYIIEKGIHRRSDFVSLFESVCTLTALEFFDVYKTNFKHRKFLEVEHLYSGYNIVS